MTQPPLPSSASRLDDLLCFALYAATNAVTRSYRPLLKQIGLTYPQYLVMIVLWQDGACSVHAIAQRLSLPPNAVSPLIDRLEQSELVMRRRDSRDRRVVNVVLTDRGRILEQAAAQAQQSVVCQTDMSLDDIKALRDELKALTERMERDVAALTKGEPEQQQERKEPETVG